MRRKWWEIVLDFQLVTWYDDRDSEETDMRRKPRLNSSFVIQRLSDGREVRPEFVIDDFTGERIAIVQDQRPVQVLPSADVVRAQHKRATRDMQRSFLASVGIGAMAMVKPGPKATEFTIAGERYAIRQPSSPLRRV